MSINFSGWGGNHSTEPRAPPLPQPTPVWRENAQWLLQPQLPPARDAIHKPPQCMPYVAGHSQQHRVSPVKVQQQRIHRLIGKQVGQPQRFIRHILWTAYTSISCA
jgi:hypothetical protein